MDSNSQTPPEPAREPDISFAEAVGQQMAEANAAKKDAQTIELLTEIRDLLVTLQPKSDIIKP